MRKQEKYDRENMKLVTSKFKNEYVNQFKGACKIMNETQSSYIKNGCDKAIEKLPEFMCNNAKNLTEAQLSTFVDTFDGQNFALRDVSEIAKSILKEEPILNINSEYSDINDLASDYFHPIYPHYAKFWDSESINSYLDEKGENGYTIDDNEYFISFTKWEDGENMKDVYIWK